MIAIVLSTFNEFYHAVDNYFSIFNTLIDEIISFYFSLNVKNNKAGRITSPTLLFSCL